MQSIIGLFVVFLVLAFTFCSCCLNGRVPRDFNPVTLQHCAALTAFAIASRDSPHHVPVSYCLLEVRQVCLNMNYQDSVNNKTYHSKATFATLRAYKLCTWNTRETQWNAHRKTAVAVSRKHFQEYRLHDNNYVDGIITETYTGIDSRKVYSNSLKRIHTVTILQCLGKFDRKIIYWYNSRPIYRPMLIFCSTFSVILMNKMKTMRTNELPRTPTEPTMREMTLSARSRVLARFSVTLWDCSENVATSFQTSVSSDAFSIAARNHLSHQSQQPVNILDVSRWSYMPQL